VCVCVCVCVEPRVQKNYNLKIMSCCTKYITDKDDCNLRILMMFHSMTMQNVSENHYDTLMYQYIK